MDSSHRSASGSAVQSPPRESPYQPQKADSNPLVSRSSSGRDEAVTGYPARSPPRSAENRTSPPRETNALDPPASSIRDEAATASPVLSPSRSPENRTTSPKETRVLVPRALSVRDKEVNGSPLRSVHQTAQTEPRYEKENSFSTVSSFQSPPHDAENPTVSPQHKETVLGSPTRGAMTVESILRSPLGVVPAEDPSLEKATSPVVAVETNRMVTRETTSVTKARGRGGGRGSMMVESGTSRQPVIRKASVGLRIVALVLSMISFSVMAADKTSGWDGDSFDRYREFRYCLSVNVLVCVYSLFQVSVQVHHKIMKRRIMSRPVSYYFDFFMDQILAYLLMSASSSAASRNGDWVSDFGSDDFTKMISASIAMSFLAFFALALSSIISAYKFFIWNC